MTVDITKEPYNDRFDPSKQYEQVLFNPDLPLQASELTELQSILKHQNAKLGNVLMVDGDIQDGMGYTISGNNEVITIAGGDIYLDGQVRTFNEQSIPFNPLGTFKVCVALRKEAITADEDRSLMDTTSGVESYFSYGADRLKETVYLTSDETVGVPIFEFRNGGLHVDSSGNREQTRLNEILAERTYDESGSYKVEGFRIYSEPHPTNQNMLNIVLDTGRAYVRGFQVDKPTPTRVAVEKAQERNTIDSEVFWYNSSTKRGKLGSSPVARVNRVTGQVQVTREAVNRGATGDSADSLGNTSVATIVKVWSEIDGSESEVYEQGTDFQLRNGNQIDWSPAGAEPGAGTTYYVTYRYSKTLVRDSDYRVVTEGELDNFATYIDFNGLTGSEPVADTMVLVDYDYYLAREDLILLDKDGEIHVQKGQPGSLESVRMPNSIDPYMLTLGSIKIYPNSTTTEPKMSTNTRLSMIDLQNMRNRIANVEYNQAVHALDQPAMEDINPAVLRGVFTDGFINVSKYDSSHSDSKIGFSFNDAQIVLPHRTANKKRPTFLEGTSNAHTWGRLVTAPFTEEVAISQPHASETININPYEVYNDIGVLSIDPSEDNWIDEQSTRVIDETPGASVTVTNWSQAKDANGAWVMDDLATATNTSRTRDMLREAGTRTIESKVEFMRPTLVNFHAQNLRPNDNNLFINFDGKRAPITPASGFSAGTEEGTIRSNEKGEAKGRFTVPEGVRTGTREVSLENMNNFAETTYIAQGTLKTTETIIQRVRVTRRSVDPLAQSFQLREDRVVSSIDLFFASKDSNENVIVQVRGITPGGMPDKTIYAETVLTPEQIKVSSDATAVTKVIFEDPLLVDAGKEYALVLIANTDRYTMWTATRGETDVNTWNRITSNPYLTGVLYSSSNASAWTIHQDSDLKFNINVANFNETADLEFSTMTDISADAMVLMATTLTPSNTGSTWDVKLVMANEPEEITVANKEWVPLSNYEELELDQIAREVKLRAKFTANRYMSPIMSLDDLLLASFLNELSGSYVGRTVDASGGAEYNYIKLSYESFEPGTSKITPRYSTDGGSTWETFKESPIAESRTGEFTKYTYEEKVTDDLDGYDSFKVRLDFTTPNSFVRPKAQRLMSVFQYH